LPWSTGPVANDSDHPVRAGGVAAVSLAVIGRFARPMNQGPCATMRFKDP
jgi:hypothetical protein